MAAIIGKRGQAQSHGIEIQEEIKSNLLLQLQSNCSIFFPIKTGILARYVVFTYTIKVNKGVFGNWIHLRLLMLNFHV